LKKIIVKKSPPLCGEIDISGSKNAAIPILAGSILAEDSVEIDNIPNLSDIEIMKILMSEIGVFIEGRGKKLYVDSDIKTSCITQYELVRKMRGSFLLAGALLAKTGYVKISLPGGCPIGTRPIDLHLKGFKELGASIENGHGYIEIKADKLKGAKIYLDFPSVGATENLMMAACMAEGETVIKNVAAEPEIIDLANFLNMMGADIKGAGSDTIEILGKKKLSGGYYKIIPDRIEAGSYLTAFAMTNGSGKINNVIASHIAPITAKLREMGAEIYEGDNFVSINAEKRLHSSDIKTMPFPGFPTDMQAQFTALSASVDGTSIIIETVFENRFLHAAELSRMGAKIKIDGRTEVVEGGYDLSGAEVRATDLRAGAALVFAGLISKGETVISDIEHIDRGYENIVGKLQKVGAVIDYIN